MTYSGLGAPGTRTTRELDADSDLWLYVKQAIAVALCSDAILTVLILTVLTAGWWLLPILFVAFGALVGLAGLAFATWFRMSMRPWAWWVLGNLWGLVGLIGVVITGLWAIFIEPAFDLLSDQLGAFFLFPWWWYVAGALVAISIAIRLKKWIVLVIVPVGEIIAGLVVAAEPGAYAQIWDALRWVLLVYTWPIAGAAFVLGLVLLKEMGWPSAEFTLKPVDVGMLGPGGLWSFYFPWLIKEPPKPLPKRMVKLELVDGDERVIQQPEFPDSIEAIAFYRAVARGEPFAWSSTASKCKMIRSEFEDLRDRFIKPLGWAKWKDLKHHNLGVDLKAKGRAAIRGLAALPYPTEETE